MPRTDRSLIVRFLDGVERWGNRLPDPFWLFCILAAATCVLSALLASVGTSARRPEIHVLHSRHEGRIIDGEHFVAGDAQSPYTPSVPRLPETGRLGNLYLEIWSDETLVHEERIQAAELQGLAISTSTHPGIAPGEAYLARIVNRSGIVQIQSLVSVGGLRWFVTHMVDNFAHFEPLGLVLVMLMGVAVAEGSGFIPAIMRGVALGVPRGLIIPVIFVLAACGNIGSDAGVVVMPPLAAAVFRQLGMNPIAGLLVGYVGATAGFTANLFPAGTDVLAMSLTNAASGGIPNVNVLSNWYFMSLSVLLLAGLGTFVTRRYLLPRFEGGAEQKAPQVEPFTPQERRGVLAGLGAIALVGGLWLTTLLPSDGILRDPNPDLFWRSPFFKGLVPVLFTLFAAGGIGYGLTAGTIRKADDIIRFMADSMKRMGGFIVLILVISQFIGIFQHARLDELIAIRGAEILEAAGMRDYPIPFFIGFVSIIAFSNLFMGSASAKWAIFAPIFVPMFLELDFHPAFTQLLYRLGDSVTNGVSPLYPYFPILLGYVAEIDKAKAKVGTVISCLIPYSGYLLAGWMVMLAVWYLIGLPVGPDSPIYAHDSLG